MAYKIYQKIICSPYFCTEEKYARTRDEEIWSDIPALRELKSTLKCMLYKRAITYI